MGRISSLLLLLLVALLELLEAPLEGGRLSPGGPARRQSQETQSSHRDRGLIDTRWVGGGAVLKTGQKHQNSKEIILPSFKNCCRGRGHGGLLQPGVGHRLTVQVRTLLN